MQLNNSMQRSMAATSFVVTQPWRLFCALGDCSLWQQNCSHKVGRIELSEGVDTLILGPRLFRMTGWFDSLCVEVIYLILWRGGKEIQISQTVSSTFEQNVDWEFIIHIIYLLFQSPWGEWNGAPKHLKATFHQFVTFSQPPLKKGKSESANMQIHRCWTASTWV